MFQKTILSLKFKFPCQKQQNVIGEKFKFQAQDSFLEYLFLEIWRFEQRIALSEKKPPLETIMINSKKIKKKKKSFYAIIFQKGF